MAGECIYNHPAFFEWNDEDQPVVLQPLVEEEADLDAIRQAIAVCPSGAISLAEG